MRSIAGALASLLLGGCTSPQVNRCMNGAICRDDQACTEKMPVTCGVTEEVAACFGQPNRTACTRADGLPGSCIENRCGACDPNWLECRYPTWTAMNVPANSTIHGISAVAAADVYAVSDTQLLHYDGTEWSVSETFMSGGLQGVWAADGGNVYIVDIQGRIFHNDAATIEHTMTGGLRQIWGTGVDNILAVGTGNKIEARTDGVWAEYVPPTMAVTTLADVWGTKARAYAVGSNAAILQGQGASWALVAPTLGIPATNDNIGGIWGAGPSDMYLVGGSSPQTAVVYRFDGTVFTSMQVPSVPALTRVWGSGASDIYAVGSGGTILHYDGASWSTMNTLNAYVDLKAVTGIGRDIYVAGGAASIWKLSEP